MQIKQITQIKWGILSTAQDVDPLVHPVREVEVRLPLVA